MKDIYESPLSSRYASNEMLTLFSSDTRYITWRKLWVALAKAESELGLNISEEQIEELEKNVSNIDYEYVAKKEKEIRHDVMAHIHAYGEVAPKAKGIIHLGATSCYVTDNADIIIYKEGLKYIKEKLLVAIKNLSELSDKYKALPTLGYTHYQPAQLVTLGKRFSLWMQDFVTDLEDLNFVRDNMKFLGSRGTTGTEASFLELFDNDSLKVDKMNKLIAEEFGFNECFDVCGQTYPRKLDSRILNVLSSIGQSAYKMANDIRLLQHDRQIEEPFESKQVGSSAMAYKRNPMRSERICSLSRYLMSDSLNASMTSSSQWLERTLDDSAIRRISVPEAFLAADAVLRLVINVTSGLVVNEKIIEKAVNTYLPFIMTENLLMEGVKRGGDRQVIHEIIREASMRATFKMKNGEEPDLLGELSSYKEFGMSLEEMKALMNPSLYIGRCIEQVERYNEKLRPILESVEAKEEEISL